MTERRSQLRGWAQRVVIGLHAGLLLGALAVPGWAIGDALRALLGAGEAETVAALVDWRRWLALLNTTIVVSGAAVVTALALGTVFGLLCARTDMPGRRVVMALVLLGACVPVYVGAILVFSLLPLYALQGSALGAGVLCGLAYTPLAALVLGAAFRRADRELEDAALLETSAWSVVLRVTLGQARGGMILLALLVLLLVATDFTITDLLLVRTFAEEIYTGYQQDGRRVVPLLTALPVLILMATLLAAAQRRHPVGGAHWSWQSAAQPRIITLGRWRVAVGGACGLLALAAVGIPGAALLARITPLDGLAAAASGLAGELRTSAACAVLGATLVLLPAVGLAWGVVRGGALGWLIAAALVLLLALPAPVVGISLITLLNRPGPLGWLYDSPLVYALGYFVRFLPIGVLLLIPAVQRVPCELEQVARVDGCDWLGVQSHVVWPAVRGVACVVWLVVAILCFAEISATVLLAPPGWETASVRAFTLLHFGVYRDLALLALLSVGCILVPWTLLVWLLRRTLSGLRAA